MLWKGDCSFPNCTMFYCEITDQSPQLPPRLTAEQQGIRFCLWARQHFREKNANKTSYMKYRKAVGLRDLFPIQDLVSGSIYRAAQRASVFKNLSFKEIPRVSSCSSTAVSVGCYQSKNAACQTNLIILLEIEGGVNSYQFAEQKRIPLI